MRIKIKQQNEKEENTTCPLVRGGPAAADVEAEEKAEADVDAVVCKREREKLKNEHRCSEVYGAFTFACSYSSTTRSITVRKYTSGTSGASLSINSLRHFW